MVIGCIILGWLFAAVLAVALMARDEGSMPLFMIPFVLFGPIWAIPYWLFRIPWGRVIWEEGE